MSVGRKKESRKMNTREAYKALADGKRVRCATSSENGFIYMNSAGAILSSVGDDEEPWLQPGEEFVLVEVPATDEELIAEMKFLENNAGRCKPGWAEAMNYCARMLKSRKVTP
jgi:hypothetical protein